jgi:predicted DNA-binding antitoxin AbrB/MazE fold protein
MAVITVQAVYKDGVLKPKTKLNMPEGTPVEVTVTMLPMQPVGESPFASLRGIWQGLPFPDVIELSIHEIRAESSRKLDRLAIELGQALENLGASADE